MSLIFRFVISLLLNPALTRYILKIMESDVNKTLLRDDIIILKDNLPNFKLLFRKEYSMQNLVNALRKSKIKTRN